MGRAWLYWKKANTPGTLASLCVAGLLPPRLADGGFLAVDRSCTHLGCTVPWSEQDQRFACPCHASAFDITGQVLAPPATRALDLRPVRIENQVVKVDLGLLVKRTAFDPAQVTMP